MPNDNLKEHEISCNECQEFQEESRLEKAFRKVLNCDVRKILQEEWQNTNETVKRVDRVEKILLWLIIVHALEIGALLFVIFNLYQK